jgi:hypothetical protein
LGLNGDEKFATAPAALPGGGTPVSSNGTVSLDNGNGDDKFMTARGYSASVSFALRNPGAFGSGPSASSSRPTIAARPCMSLYRHHFIALVSFAWSFGWGVAVLYLI